MLRKTTPIGNPSSSDVVRLERYLCVHTVKLLATMVIPLNLRYCVTIAVDTKSCRNHIIAQDV